MGYGNRTINKSVGHAAQNQQNDVVTVQYLLNRVPPNEGGPTEFVAKTGVASPKFVRQIHAFQLRQFGWSVADGRVDPGHQTLRRLNEFDRTVSPIVPQRFLLMQMGEHTHLTPGEPSHWFYELLPIHVGLE